MSLMSKVTKFVKSFNRGAPPAGHSGDRQSMAPKGGPGSQPPLSRTDSPDDGAASGSDGR